MEQWEKQNTRSLYETAFPEDSNAFVDYYYQWKTRDNEILVMEGNSSVKDGFFQVMIHLNPYKIWMNGRQERIPYLVAVAADPGCRRQGKMGRVMWHLLRDLEQRKMPFTFLLPADPAYYQGQGFVFFPDMERTGIQKEEQGMVKAANAPFSYGKEKRGFKWKEAAEGDIPAMVEFSNGILMRRHDLVISRDGYYYKRLLEETKVEHGGILLLLHSGVLCGMLTFAVSDTGNIQPEDSGRAEIKELLLDEYVSEEEGMIISQEALQEAGIAGNTVSRAVFPFEQMMVRITSLTETVPLLKSRTRRTFQVKVRDSVIEANNGCYRIILDWDGGRIFRISEEEATIELDISRLTEELWKDVSVYLNEWV